MRESLATSSLLLEPLRPGAILQKSLSILYLILVTYYVAIGTWLSSSEDLIRALGNTSREIALMGVAFIIFIIISAETVSLPFWSSLSDRAGRRWCILVGGFVQCLGFAIFSHVAFGTWIVAGTLIGAMDSIDAVASAIVVDCIRAGAAPGAEKDIWLMRALRSVWFNYSDQYARAQAIMQRIKYNKYDNDINKRSLSRSQAIAFENEIALGFGLVNIWPLTGFIIGLGLGSYLSTQSYLLPIVPLIGVSPFFLAMLFALQHFPETSRQAYVPNSPSTHAEILTGGGNYEELPIMRRAPSDTDSVDYTQDEFDFDDDDDDDACSGNNSSIKWLRIDALEPANVCLQTAAAFQSQIQTVDILFESPTSRLDGFVLGLTYFATHLQAASLITGMYWTHKTERWIPFGILIYYPIILIAIFLGLLWYLTVLIPCLGSKLSLALCLALATAARAALAILQEETNLFSEPKIHSIQLIYHAAFLFGLVIAATISIGLIPVVNGMLSTHVSRQIRGGRTQGGILHVSKVAMFVAVVAFAILTSLNRRNATWLVSPAVSTFAALVCVLWMHLKRNRCASCVVVPEATTFMNDFDTGNHPLQTCTDPDIAAQYGTFPGDMSNSFATMT